jgi:hypothetical protein
MAWRGRATSPDLNSSGTLRNIRKALLLNGNRVLENRQLWLVCAELAVADHRGGAFPPATGARSMRVPRRYIILIDGKPLLVIRAYTKRQARELVEVRLADTTGVQIVAQR